MSLEARRRVGAKGGWGRWKGRPRGVFARFTKEKKRRKTVVNDTVWLLFHGRAIAAPPARAQGEATRDPLVICFQTDRRGGGGFDFLFA